MISISYISFPPKTDFLPHALPAIKHLIGLPYLGLNCSSLQPAGELLLLLTRLQPAAEETLKVSRQRKSKENALFPAHLLRQGPPIHPRCPPPNTVESWLRVRAEGPGSREADSRRRSGGSHSPECFPRPPRQLSPPRLVAPSIRSLPGGQSPQLPTAALTAPAQKSSRPQHSVLVPDRPSPPSSSPRHCSGGQCFGASKDSPPLSWHRLLLLRSWRRIPQPSRGITRARRWGPTPEHPRGVH